MLSAVSMVAVVHQAVLGAPTGSFTCSFNPLGLNPICDVAQIVDGVNGAVDMVTLIGGEFIKLFTDPVAFVGDVIKWILRAILPAEAFGGLLGILTPQDGSYAIYGQVKNIGLMFAGLACVARVLRIVLDQRAPASVLFVDVLPRFLIAFGVIQVGWELMAFVVNAATQLAISLSGLILGASVAGTNPLQLVYTVIAVLVTRADVLVLIGIIPVILMALYCLILLVLRAVMLSYAVAVAPLCIAIAVFDHRNKFVQWWADLFFGAALIPVVLWPCVTVSVTLALHIMGSSSPEALLFGPGGFVISGVIQGLTADVVLFSGLWLSGKVVHQLTWRHFSHGGALGMIGAASLALSSPFQAAQKGILAGIALSGKTPAAGGGIDKLNRFASAMQGFADPLPGTPKGGEKSEGSNGAGSGGAPGGGGGGGGGGVGGGMKGVAAGLALTAATAGTAAPLVAARTAAGTAATAGTGSTASGLLGGSGGGSSATGLLGGGTPGGGSPGGGMPGGGSPGGGSPGGGSPGGGMPGGGSPGGGSPGGGSPGGGSPGSGLLGGGGAQPPRFAGRPAPLGGMSVRPSGNVGGQFGSLVNQDAESRDHYDHFMASALDMAMDSSPQSVWQGVVEAADGNGDDLDLAHMTFDDAKQYFAANMNGEQWGEAIAATQGDYLNTERHDTDALAQRFL